MSQGKIFNDKSIQSLNAILRKLPDLGAAEINYLIDRLVTKRAEEAKVMDAKALDSCGSAC